MTHPFLKFLIAALFAVQPVFAQDDQTTADTVLAEVNGKEITFGHVVSLASRLPQDYDQVQPDVLFNGILDQLIQQELLAAAVDQSSKAAKLSIENEIRTVLAAEAIGSVSLEATSEENVIAAYEAEIANFQPSPEFRASHILVGTEDEALELVETLDGGADFAELAREKSTGPSGPNGGELGWFGPGDMVPPFDEAVQAMSVGDVAGPVETQFGWHVILLSETRESAPPSINERYQALAEQLRIDAIEAYITQLEVEGSVVRTDVTVDVEQIRNSDLLK